MIPHKSQFRGQVETSPKISELIPQDSRNDNKQRVVEVCHRDGINFVDYSFVPGFSSLVGQSQDEVPKDWEGLRWARCSDIFKDQVSLLEDIDACDIHQGILGDCYLLCCLSALAETPCLIKRLFDIERTDQYCMYSVWLNINGMWTEVIIDDYIPVITHDDGGIEIAFSNTYDNEIWVILIEKAYAKIYGGYWPIEGGDICHAMRDMTGAPYARLENLQDSEWLWSRLVAAKQRQWVLTAATEEGKVKEELRDNGIVSGHAYCILDCQEVVSSRGQPAKIVEIRNPWGSGEWKGDWCDTSDLWTDQLKQDFYVENRNDGVFWMSIEDFCQTFEEVGVSMVEKNFFSDSKVVDFDESNKAIVVFELTEKSEVTISLDQIDERAFNFSEDYNYSYMRVSVGRIGSEDIQFVDCQMSCSRSIFISEKLPQGSYVVLVEAYWTSDLTRRAVVGVYSSSKPKISPHHTNPDVFRRSEYMLWANFCRNNRDSLKKKNGRLISEGELNAPIEIKELSGFDFGVTLQAYYNDSEKNMACLTFKEEENEGFEILFENEVENGLKEITVNGQDVEVIIYKINPTLKTYKASISLISEFLSSHALFRDFYILGYLNMIIKRNMTPNSDQFMITDYYLPEKERQQKKNSRFETSVPGFGSQSGRSGPPSRTHTSYRQSRSYS